MKNLPALLILLLTSIFTFGQIEFPNHSNGLIYNNTTINQLQTRVNSLHLKFDNTTPKTYSSRPQAKGHYFTLKRGNFTKAKKDLEKGISFDDFLKKYPEVEVERNLLVVQSKGKNLQGEPILTFSADLHYKKRLHEYTISKKAKYYKNEPKNNVVFNVIQPLYYGFQLSPSFSRHYPYLAGFFFTTEIAPKVLPEKYARMIQYSDFMMDNNTPKFKENATYEHQYFPKLHSGLSKSEQIKWLDYLRSIRIRTECGHSPLPKIHDFNIARLAAETSNWKLFLKAHLDILYLPLESRMFFNNEKEGRNTYIKELEAIHIDISSFFLGMDLQIEDPIKNHHAPDHLLLFLLPETQHKEEIKNELLSMIQDKDLDEYNRILAYYRFLNYTNEIEDKVEKEISIKNLKKAVATLPDYLSNKIAFGE